METIKANVAVYLAATHSCVVGDLYVVGDTYLLRAHTEPMQLAEGAECAVHIAFGKEATFIPGTNVIAIQCQHCTDFFERRMTTGQRKRKAQTK